MLSNLPHRPALAGAAVVAALLAWTSADARVTKIVTDDTKPLATATGQTIAYQQISGRAFGELDPRDPLNAIIQDIELGKDADGKVRYVASWVLSLPVDASQISGVMFHDVPNRGGPIQVAVQERNFADVHLASACQGDNAGGGAAGPTQLA